MKTAIEFLSLRPVFTRRMLYGVWYLYLVATLLNLVQYVPLLYQTGLNYAGNTQFPYFLWLVSPILFALAHLALVRMFLEMALHFIEKRSLDA